MGYYPDVIQKAFDEIQSKRELIFSLIDTAKIAVRAEKEFKDQLKHFRIDIGYSFNSLQGILIHCSVDDMAEVIPLLRWLAFNGYPKKGKPEDYPAIRRRTWKCGDIQVSAFLPYSGGSKCEFVKVGVKEEPVYELQCKDNGND